MKKIITSEMIIKKTEDLIKNLSKKQNKFYSYDGKPS